MRPLFFTLILNFAPVVMPIVHAQQALLPAPPQNMKMRPDAIAKGEIGLEGRVKALTGSNSFDIEASSFTTEDGRIIEFETARPKSIQPIGDVIIVVKSNLGTRLTMNELKLGMRVRLVGRNVEGQPFQARFIDFNHEILSKSERGRGVPTSAPVANVIIQGADAFDAGDFSRALTYFKQAQDFAINGSDQPGLASSLVWLGSAYVQLNQLQKAEEAFKQSIEVANTGSPQTLPNALTNYASLLRRTKRMREAIGLLERARALSSDQSEKVQVTIIDNLASAYYADSQWGKSADLSSSVVARKRALEGANAEISALLNAASAQFKAKNVVEGNKNLTLAQERFQTLSTPKERAAAHVAFGTFYIRILGKTDARQHLEKALAEFEALNDTVSAERVRASLRTFDTPAKSDK